MTKRTFLHLDTIISHNHLIVNTICAKIMYKLYFCFWYIFHKSLCYDYITKPKKYNGFYRHCVKIRVECHK